MKSLFIKTIFARAISNVAGHFVLTFLIGNLYGSKGVGSYGVLIGLVLFISTVSNYGFSTSLTKHVAQNEICDSLYFLRKTLSISAGAAVFLLVLLSLMLEDILMLINKLGIKELVALGVFSAPFYCGSLLLSGYYKGLGKPVEASLLEHGSIALFTSFLLLPFSFFFHFEKALGLSVVFGSIIAFSFGLYGTRFWKESVRVPLVSQRCAFWSNSNVFFINTLSNMVRVTLVPVIVASHVSLEELGWFRLSEQLAMSVGFVVMVIATVYPPKFAINFKNDNAEEVRRSYQESRRYGVLLALPAFVMISVAAKYLSVFFIGEFNDAILVVVILFCLAQFVDVVIGPVDYLLMMTDKDKEFTLIKLILLCMLVGCLLLLEDGVSVVVCASLVAVYAMVLRVFSYAFYVWKNSKKWI